MQLRITPAGRVICQHLHSALGEFPQIDWRCGCTPHRFTYLAANFAEAAPIRLPNAIVKFDHDRGEDSVHQLPQNHHVSEPIFVPRCSDSAEDDGWLLAVAYDPAEHRSRLLVLDAKDLEADPVLVAHLQHHVPLGFHGMFTPRVPSHARGQSHG